jgi:hypothetical protein
VCVRTCLAGYADCNGNPNDGCETQLGTTTNCAACGNACGYPNGIAGCVSSACVLTGCNTTYGNCDNNAANGCEASLYTTTNCGSCGNPCTNSHGSTTCPAGLCVPSCATNYASCDGNANNGCETATTTVTSCGSCTNDCTDDFANATATCSGSPLACAMGSCNPGYGNCSGGTADGCETNTQTSATNCGSCGAVCSTNHTTAVSCVAGGCVDTCAAGWGNCDGDALSNGCEHDLIGDPANCGSCGHACSTGQGCSGGACIETPCAGLCTVQKTFTVTPPTGYQSGDLGTGAICWETTSGLVGGGCSNFTSPRTLSVNGVAMNCAGWTLPPTRNGGYCIQTTAGDSSWASFLVW